MQGAMSQGGGSVGNSGGMTTTFNALTVMATVATAESSEPSFTLKVKLSAPVKPALGVYNRLAPTPESVPLAGGATTV